METLLAEIEIMAKEREAGGSEDKGNGHGNGESPKKELPVLKI